MLLSPHFQLMAHYNQWMNDNLYTACARLDAADLNADMGAFFGSIAGTLNHLLVADTIWLKRFGNHPGAFPSLEPLNELPAPERLGQILYPDFDDLRQARRDMDAIISQLCEEATDDDLHTPLSYTNTQGKPFRRSFGMLLQHLFNHQTHHRGQVTTLLSQKGVDVGVTDLLALIPDV